MSIAFLPFHIKSIRLSNYPENPLNVKEKVKKQDFKTDQEFKQKKVFGLNKKSNVDMFSTALGMGKHLQWNKYEENWRKEDFGLKRWKKDCQKKKRNLYEIIKKSVENMNSFRSSKYKQTPSEIKFIKLRN